MCSACSVLHTYRQSHSLPGLTACCRCMSSSGATPGMQAVSEPGYACGGRMRLTRCVREAPNCLAKHCSLGACTVVLRQVYVSATAAHVSCWNAHEGQICALVMCQGLHKVVTMPLVLLLRGGGPQARVAGLGAGWDKGCQGSSSCSLLNVHLCGADERSDWWTGLDSDF